MDVLGDKMRVISGATGTKSTENYYAVKAIGGSVTLTLTPVDTSSNDTITTTEIANGDVVTLKDLWASVEKTAGDGSVLCYYEV
jgi:hypothetical protein